MDQETEHFISNLWDSMVIKKVITNYWTNNTSNINEDVVCVEEEYKLYIGDDYITNLTASPNNLKELGVGYVISEGYLKPENIVDAQINNDKITIIAKKSNKTNLKKEDNLKLSLKTVLKIIQYMATIEGIWKITGGTHWACLFDLKGNEITTIEDIGRHNAVDKVIGYGILNNIDLKDKILVSSGRMPYSMVKKAVNANISMILSKSPSTDKGIQLAKNNNIILIGFARKNRFTVYSGFERIVDD